MYCKPHKNKVCRDSFVRGGEPARVRGRLANEKWKRTHPEEHRIAQKRGNRIFRERHPERLAENDRRKRAAKPGLYREIDKAKRLKKPELYADIRRTAKAKRRASELNRNVTWADAAKIREVYALARMLTEATGVPHHVDHVLPLQGKLVSGLHVHNNLQVLPGIENTRKGNRFQVEFQQDSRDLRASEAAY